MTLIWVSEFLADYRTKWKARTFCAEDFLVELLVERCANYKGSGHPSSASPACYEEDPKLAEGQALECPAPVAQLMPALPGTVTIVKPQGERLAQRPRPTNEQPKLPEGAVPPGVTSE